MDVPDLEELGFAGAIEICSKAVKSLRSHAPLRRHGGDPVVLPLGIFVFSHSVACAPLLPKLTQMKRSNALITGKRLAAFCLFAMYTSCLVVMLGFFGGLAKHNSEHVVGRVFLGVLLLVLWTAGTLMGIVIQSVFYFVGRAYHQESIDRSAMAEKLKVGRVFAIEGRFGWVSGSFRWRARKGLKL